MENYLNIKDYQNRKPISKLRTNSHLLKIIENIEYAHNVDNTVEHGLLYTRPHMSHKGRKSKKPDANYRLEEKKL